MNALFITLTVLVIIACVLMTVVVLLQNGKGDGLASNFVAGNQTFGVRQTADILEKITWGLCIVILVLSICTSFVAGGRHDKTKQEVTNAATEAEEAQNPDFTVEDVPAAPADTTVE